MWISSPTHEQPFRSQYFRRQPENDKQIDEIMTCMGPGWFMHKDRYWELGGLDEGHGGWGQMGVEVALKAWLSGGALMVNKKTWFSHWFRGGGVPVGFKSGFPYSIKQRDIDAARAYSQDLWLNNKWPKQVRTTQWLVEKFKPPSWEFTQGQNSVDDINKYFYHHIHLQKKDPTWKGLTCIKMPSDLVLYAQVIQAEKPKWIVETGTAYGGSSLYFQDILELVGEGGKVVTIDKEPERRGVTDPRITYLVGSSADSAIVEQVKTMVGKDSVMVILDSDHSRQHVKWELHYYAPLVTSGQYLVVEDCFDRHGRPWGPGEARDWFLPRHQEFVQTNLDHRYVVGVCRGGWLKRK
jgi:cephalosporin hydroxylase